MTPAERLQSIADGRNPALIALMPSGFAVMSDTQFLRGYCLLLAYPMVEQLLDLPEPSREQFLTDMAKLGAAVKEVTGCRRVNFGIYGNQDPFLHAHIWPRYDDEPDELRTIPPLSFPADIRTDKEFAFDRIKHGGLLERIRQALERPQST